MALPEQVLERLSREPPNTTGWSYGLLLFSGGILFIALLIYFGLAFGYEPYLNSQISDLQTQIDTAAKAVSPADQANLTTFYSELANVQAALAHHVTQSAFFAWLEKDTEANVYFTNLSISSANHISLTGSAPSEADVAQQMAIFEAAPEVQSVALSSVTQSDQTKQWQFTMTLTMLMNSGTSQ